MQAGDYVVLFERGLLEFQRSIAPALNAEVVSRSARGVVRPRQHAVLLRVEPTKAELNSAARE